MLRPQTRLSRLDNVGGDVEVLVGRHPTSATSSVRSGIAGRRLPTGQIAARERERCRPRRFTRGVTDRPLPRLSGVDPISHVAMAVDGAERPASSRRPSGLLAPATLVAIGAIAILAGCGDVAGSPAPGSASPGVAIVSPSPIATPSSQPTPTPIQAPSPTPATATPTPTLTPSPAATPAPTPTPARTAKPKPAATPRPTRAVDPPGDVWTGAREPARPAGHPAGQIEAVAPWGKGFVAVGRGCSFNPRAFCDAIVWTSRTGRSWTRVAPQKALNPGFSIPLSGPEIGMFDVATGRPGIVAIGYSARPDLQATAWFSRDGITWKRRWIGSPYSSRVNAVTWTGSRFVIVGEDRSDLRDWRDLGTATARAAVWTSRDGLTWTRVRHTRSLNAGGFVDTMEDPITGGMRDVVSSRQGLVAVGSVCRSRTGLCFPAVWRSSNGLRWTRVRDLPAVGGVLKAVARAGAAGGGGYVAVGRRSCGSRAPIEVGDCTALVLTSPDGVTWKRRTFRQDGDLRTITWVGDRFFATAPDGPVSVWTSRTGSRWRVADVQGGPSVRTGNEYAAWHFAATARRAAWLGTPPGRHAPRAWVSVARSDR